MCYYPLCSRCDVHPECAPPIEHRWQSLKSTSTSTQFRTPFPCSTSIFPARHIFQQWSFLHTHIHTVTMVPEPKGKHTSTLLNGLSMVYGVVPEAVTTHSPHLGVKSSSSEPAGVAMLAARRGKKSVGKNGSGSTKWAKAPTTWPQQHPPLCKDDSHSASVVPL